MIKAKKVFHVSLLYKAISGYENTMNKCYLGEQTILVTKHFNIWLCFHENKRSLKGPQRLDFLDLTFVIHVIWKVFKFCTTFILHAITNYLQVKSYKGKRDQNFKFSEDWHFDPYLSLSKDAQFTSWRFLQNFNVYILTFCVHF